MPQVVYARHEHGGHRVERDTNGLTVHWPNGPIVYPSVRQTLAAIMSGDPLPAKGTRTPHRTFESYFRLRASKKDLVGDVLTLFAPPAPKTEVGVLVVHTPSAKPPASPRRSRRAPPLPTPAWDGKGIDLVNRGHEVRKLFYAGFMGRVTRYGYDPEEVLQEVYAGLLVRNKGKCPFDPKKSSFGHYVHMVCECIVSNYHRKHNRHAQAEQFGHTAADGLEVDVASADLAVVEADQEEALSHNFALASLTARLNEAACSVETSTDMALVGRCLPLLSKGMTRLEVARHLVEVAGLPRNRVLQAVDFIRNVAGEWGASLR